MKDETPQDEETVPCHGRLASATLRVIDASLRTLQQLRDRMEPPAEEEVAPRGHARSKEPADDESLVASPAPRPKSLLRRALIVLMCLLLGGGVGALLSYRGFSKALDSRKATIEDLQEEIRQSKSDEEVLRKSKEKYQRDAGDYRKELRETQQAFEDYKIKVEKANSQPAPAKRVQQPAPQRSQANTAKAKPRTPQKSGTCIADANDPAGDILGCIKEFNKP